MKKKKKKKESRIKSLFLICGSILVVIVLFVFLIIALKRPIYQIESRGRNIEKSQKKDSDGMKTVGWLRVQGTNIDYPIIYAPGISLDYKTDDFVWTEADYTSLNNIVYISGHNIKNLSSTPLVADESHSRFEQLMSFVYHDFVKDNQYIQYSIYGHDYLYKIFSVYFEDINNLDLYNDGKYNREDIKRIINNSLEKNIFDINVDVSEKDNYIILNTCTRMLGNKQLVVGARLVRDNEKIELSNVKKSKEYKTVENVLKGGDSDEA